jgi:chromosome segregation ATPase
MGYGGGAPSWVYKNQIARLEAELRSASGRADSVLQDEIDKLRRRIKELESENAELKRDLGEYRNPLPK